MRYDEFLVWCIDMSREDRPKFVDELPLHLNALLNASRPARKRRSFKGTMPGGPPKGALKLALKSARNDLTNPPPRA
jgi:hypothetical protein